MKKIKLVLIIVFIFLVSGCTATYELTIKDNEVFENLKVIELNTAIFDVRMDNGWTIRESYEALLNGDQFSEKNYKVKSLNNSNQLGVEYSSDALSSISNSSVLNQCYNNYSVTELDGTVTIDTGTDFKCYEYYENLETIKIVFNTNHEVYSTNAEEIDGNKYIWNFTEDSDKQIKISYKKDSYNKSFDYTTIIIIVCMIIAVGIFSYFLIKRNKENNTI